MNWDLLNSRLNSSKIGEISLNTILLLAILGLVIFAFFFVLRKYVIPYLNSRKAVKRATSNAYRLEVIIWCMYTIFAIYNLLSDTIWITAIILLIVILLGWNFWRDLFSGVIFKLDNKFSIGDPVNYKEHNGVIEEIEKRFLVLKSDKGELIRIPFRKLSSALLIRKQAKGKLLSSKLVIQTKQENSENFITKVQGIVFSCPWAISNEKPQVLIQEDGKLSVQIFGIDNESLEKAESFIRQKLA